MDTDTQISLLYERKTKNKKKTTISGVNEPMRIRWKQENNNFPWGYDKFKIQVNSL